MSQPGNKSVLIVDDKEINRKAASMFLGASGFSVQLANDGLEAWKLIQGGANFALIFSDVEMPNMNGFELLMKVRRESNCKTVPFIICTTLAQPEHVEKSKKLGATYHLPKPFAIASVKDALKAAGF